MHLFSEVLPLFCQLLFAIYAKDLVHDASFQVARSNEAKMAYACLINARAIAFDNIIGDHSYYVKFASLLCTFVLKGRVCECSKFPIPAHLKLRSGPSIS